MSNLLLITDVARLRKIFGRLTENRNIRLRVVNNLEKGGEEITVEKPDVVFVQTHLSGLSADILLMHLKKQLGRKRSRFVLLAPPGQITDKILKPYQGWLDSSLEDNQLMSELQQLLASLLSNPKKKEEIVSGEQVEAVAVEVSPQAVSSAESSALLDHTPHSEEPLQQEILSELQLPVTPPPQKEPALEEQGITYPPRQRLKVYSDFNISFDSAVSSSPEPETIEQATPPPLRSKDWNVGKIDAVEVKPARSGKGVFLLWLVPVVIAVVVLTYFQQQEPGQKSEPVALKTAPTAVVAKPVSKPSAKAPAAPPLPLQPAPSVNHPKAPPAVAASLTALPKFIPVEGLVKQYGKENPGWELYMGQATEFRVLKKGNAIKAIQVMDRGLEGISEQFMKKTFLQVTNNTPVFSPLTSEKKEGYKIQRGSIADNIRVVYYRDEQGGKLRAFVLTWQ